MSGTLTTYDPDSVIMTFRPFVVPPELATLGIGVITLEGFIDGTKIRVARSAPNFTQQDGSDGETVHIHRPNRSGTAIASLMMSSVTNDYLSILANADDAVPGAGLGELNIEDFSGRSKFSAAQARLAGFPEEVSFNTGDVAGSDWTFLCGVLLMNPAGNDAA